MELSLFLYDDARASNLACTLLELERLVTSIFVAAPPLSKLARSVSAAERLLLVEAAVAAVAAGGVDAPGGAGLFLFPFFIPDSIVVDIIAWPWRMEGTLNSKLSTYRVSSLEDDDA